MTKKQYRLNKWGTRLLKNNRPLFDWTNEADEIVDLLNDLNDMNKQLELSSTMYYNLFKELQRQMQGVKGISDLDSKDFEDLIELSKGNVFTDEIGWVHLPIKELQFQLRSYKNDWKIFEM